MKTLLLGERERERERENENESVWPCEFYFLVYLCLILCLFMEKKMENETFFFFNKEIEEVILNLKVDVNDDVAFLNVK